MSALGKWFRSRWWLSLLVACMLATGPASAGAAARKAESKRAVSTSVAKKPAAKRSVSNGRTVRLKKATRAGKHRVRPSSKSAVRVRRAAAVVAPRLSYGQVYGLHETDDPLDLKSSVALVLDQETDEVLFSKNSQAVLPIASLTKLMTALVVIEAQQPLDDILTITAEDIDTEKGSRSRLALGTRLTRGEMLHLALMSSENRAANALGRHYPGGLEAFVAAMNQKALELGMHDTRYAEPTGLSSRNQSSARDLATLVKAAHQHPLIRELSTSPEYEVAVGRRYLQYRNTNGLVYNSTWEIGLQKTGYISEAGRCLVMQAQLAGRNLIMVFLDSAGRYSRIGDAERVRKWLEELSLSEEDETEDPDALPRVTS